MAYPSGEDAEGIFDSRFGFFTDGHRRGFTINNGGAAALV